MEKETPMTPTLRKLNLAGHVVSSVGWVGSVAAFLALSIAGLMSADAETVRGAYVAMNLIGQFVIVPLSVVALLTGIIQSLGTEWGLFRHYWLLMKFLLTLAANFLLLLHQFTAVGRAAKLASAATAGTMPSAGRTGVQLVGDAGLGLLVLLIITILSFYKPWGLTRYGRRIKAPQRPDTETPAGLRAFLAIVGILAAVGLVLSHLTGHGFHHGH
jgi:hypothetical protein